jgi:hypothetical protein
LPRLNDEVTKEEDEGDLGGQQRESTDDLRGEADVTAGAIAHWILLLKGRPLHRMTITRWVVQRQGGIGIAAHGNGESPG